MNIFTRTQPFECKRCGLCCQGRGDLLGPPEDGEEEPDDCSALSFEGGLAVCDAYDCRRDFCEQYPWDEWCQREMVERGIWDKYMNRFTNAKE